jgi:hypothetical protein
MTKSVLMIAFHFPPAAMGSGHLRTLAFARHLPALGWEPTVLSATRAAYTHVNLSNNELIPDGCRVQRAFSLDSGRHLAIRGRYPGFLAAPDRWASWWPAAVWHGLRLIRQHHVEAIWSTYPIMTAHGVARTLSRRTGLPWIADFRDPVPNLVPGGNRYTAAAQARMERAVLRDATRIVFTTPGAMHDYAERYPEASAASKLSVIENGYDEAAFEGISDPVSKNGQKPLIMVHSGLLYPDGRNPLPFFNALAQLKAAGRIKEGDLKVILRASGSVDAYAREIERLGLAGLVALGPSISHREALAEQAEADALLLFQGEKFDRQIPAKVYEYLRVGRPIFALVGANGDTAAVLRETGGAELAPIDDADVIATRLVKFIDALLAGRAPAARPEAVARRSRREGAAILGNMLNQVVL